MSSEGFARILRAAACMCDRLGSEAGTVIEGRAEMERPAGGRLSVLAKSKSWGVGDVPVGPGRRLAIGAVLVYDVAWLVSDGRLIVSDKATTSRSVATYMSLLMPPRPNDPSPVAPNFPLPSTPVVELLIRRALGADPAPSPFAAPLEAAPGGGLVADRTDVLEGTDAGMIAVGWALGSAACLGPGDGAESDKRSVYQ